VLCILSAVFQLCALLYVLCAFVILNKDYLLTYLILVKNVQNEWKLMVILFGVEYIRNLQFSVVVKCAS